MRVTLLQVNDVYQFAPVDQGARGGLARLLTMKKAIEKFTEDGSAAAVETWEQYMPKARPTVDMNQVAQAEQQEAFKSKASQLRSRAKYADQIDPIQNEISSS